MRRQDIAQIRHFNRFYTRILALTTKYQLATKFTVLENRLLLEIDQGLDTATQLQRLLQLDKGYLSRLIKKLTDQGLLVSQPNGRDGRSKRLVLTAAGQSALADSNRQADAQIKRLFGATTDAEIQAVLAGMAAIKTALKTSDDWKGIE